MQTNQSYVIFNLNLYSRDYKRMVLGTHVRTFRLIDVIITMYEHVSPTVESISPMGLGCGRKTYVQDNNLLCRSEKRLRGIYHTLLYMR